MKSTVYIKGIAVYHPEKTVKNDEYINSYPEKGESLEEYKHLLLQIYGREQRYEIDNGSGENSTETEGEKTENTLTMEIEVAKQLLEQLGMRGEQVDGIIVANQIPEHYVPADSLMVHRAINGSGDCFTYDINCNCMSMVMAMVHGYMFMKEKRKMKNVLVIGGDYLTQSQDPYDKQFYGTFGDVACAIMLTRIEDKEKKIFDYDFFVNSTQGEKIIFPACGISNLYKGENTLTTSRPIHADLDDVVRKIKGLLKDNHLEISDIKDFCFTQFTKKNNDYVKEKLGIPKDKAPFVSNKYGYTGPTSPFLAFYDLVERNQIKRGDYILFWTFGAGTQHIFTLVQY